MNFELISDYQPTGDQPDAIAQLTEGILEGVSAQTLLGVTGSGKTFTIANVIKNINKPTLILSHNKTLAAQLYGEFKSFFLIMRWSITCLIMITISLRPTFRPAIPTLRRTCKSTKRLTSSGWQPLPPCSPAVRTWWWSLLYRAFTVWGILLISIIMSSKSKG